MKKSKKEEQVKDLDSESPSGINYKDLPLAQQEYNKHNTEEIEAHQVQ